MKLYRAMIINNQPMITVYELDKDSAMHISLNDWDLQNEYWTDSYDKASNALLTASSDEISILLRRVQEQQSILTKTIDLIAEYKEI